MHSFEINANPGLTPASPLGALVPPGVYTVRLTVNGKAHTEKVVVTSDPRSPVSLTALRAEDALIRKLNASERLSWNAFQQVDTMRVQLRAMTASDSTSGIATTIRAFIAKLDSLGGRAPAPGGGFGGCTINLVAADHAEQFQATVAPEYERITKLKPEIYVCTAANGAEEVK